ncbi:ABC transporter permease [Helicobacter sp.]|uniref:ABC transporter permease n=1 Tax=Helicobacter sp. TaxID=218 RepID=UPI0025BFC123|nr:iron ABC transporter permease [Helicobacter sp.]MCI5968320.1 iron ABC transporter permease [Helicobacter sp.]MDY2584871.1 iron ABC transporter permease [Helicobacter sp.]
MTLKALKIGAILLALFMLLPVISIFIELFYILIQSFNSQNLTEIVTIKENLAHFFNYLFLKFVKDTFIVTIGVVILSLFLGLTTAYLIANFNFYFSKVLENILILPLAIPAYILAFVYVGIMDFNGFFHNTFGIRIDFFNIYGVIFVLAISLYPYVYLFAKTSFKTEAKEVYELAKISHYTEFKFFRKFALLIARPAILASIMLIVMETLSDYGASAYLGMDTFSAGIFKLWYDLSDSYSASVLSGFLMLFIFLLMFIEYQYKMKKKYSFNQNLTHSLPKRRLSRIQQIFASLYCLIIAAVGFIIPFIWLIFWALKDEKLLQSEFYIIAFKTLALAFLSALIIVALALFLSFIARIVKNNLLAIFILKTSSLGYAIPGAAIGISIMIAFIFLDKISGTSLFGQSLVVLVFAYIIRFLATAIYSLESGYTKIHHCIDEASLHLKVSYWNLFSKVHLPLLKHFLLLAFIVAFIDIVKELPLSRILAPFGFETLSVKAFWYATDERIYDAALPSLLIVLLSLLALMIFTRKNDVTT